MTDRVALDCVIIGAGIIGLAMAKVMSKAGLSVAVLEAEPAIGLHTSSRNSEVIHAGIYYPEGSLKAQHCVNGRGQLYDYCRARHVPHKKIGKVIVATSVDEISAMEALFVKGQRNGVEGLKLIGKAELKRLEPHVRGEAAVLSSETGIIDSHSFMVALQHDAEISGAIISLNSPVSSIAKTASGFLTNVRGEGCGGDDFDITSTYLINSAGHGAVSIAHKIDALDKMYIPKPYYAKGSYVSYSGRSPFSRLIYPAPVAGGLGVHATLDLAGSVRFGPDVEWTEEYDIVPDETRLPKFYAAIRKYWPDLEDGTLRTDYCGVRPKILPPEQGASDFVISDESVHKIAGLVNLFGIESPGLTSALSIAHGVRDNVLQTSLAVSFASQQVAQHA